jgi:hypothetical protein
MNGAEAPTRKPPPLNRQPVGALITRRNTHATHKQAHDQCRDSIMRFQAAPPDALSVPPRRGINDRDAGLGEIAGVWP